MVETTESLRERALAAWRERKQEMAVEAERRETEQKLRVVRSATSWALRALDSPVDALDVQVQAEAARLAGIEAYDPRPLFPGVWTVDLVVDHITLRWTGGSIYEDRFELVAECPDCGGDVLFGHRIRNLTALGIALDEQMTNPKGMHRCPNACPATGAPHVYEADYDETVGRYTACVECKASPPDLNDDGEPMPEFAPTIVNHDVDPAHVLLNALQGYIHAAVNHAVRDHGRPMPEPAIDDEEPF